MRFFGVFALALLCAGCVTDTSSLTPTASGRPEVTIANATPEKVKPVIVSKMVNAGYRITKDTPYELSFDKPVENLAMALLLGSKYDAQPSSRITYTFAQLGPDTRVIADVAVITNPGSAFERRTEMNRGVDANYVQEGLQRLRAEMDPNSAIARAQRNKIVLGVTVVTRQRAQAMNITVPDHGLYIAAIDENSVASGAGIKKGDMLVAFNGVPVETLEALENAQAALKAGSSTKVIIWRTGEEHEVTVKFPDVQQPTVEKKTKSKRTAI